jgi:hypothetical protein
MKIVSIDIGYHHLGIVEAILNEAHELTVTRSKLVNLTRIPHIKVKMCDCHIPHTNEIADLVAHFIQEYGEWLDEADKILIERQPPTGLTQIETLLLFLYRSKTKLVSPNSMHKHFCIRNYDYERRKEMTIKIAEPYLQESSTFHALERKHDIADAVCMIIYETHKDRERYRIKCINRTLPFDNYRYENNLRKTSRYFEH